MLSDKIHRDDKIYEDMRLKIESIENSLREQECRIAQMIVELYKKDNGIKILKEQVAVTLRRNAELIIENNDLKEETT